MSGAFEKLKADLAERGVVAEAEPELEAYKPHAVFERETDAEGQTRYASPTDCEGMLRVEDRSAPVWVAVCDACEFVVGVPMLKSDPEHLTAYLLGRAGIPELFAGKQFDKTDAAQQPTLSACREYVRLFKRDPMPAVALWGGAGRGKSHLLSLMVETLIRNHGVEATYRSMYGMLDELRDAAREGTFESHWRRMLNVPVLALDDLGAGRMTEAAQEWFSGLVDHRYSAGKPLLVATNVPPQAWERAFSERTASRLRGICVALHLEGPDRREQGVQTSMVDAA